MLQCQQICVEGSGLPEPIGGGTACKTRTRSGLRPRLASALGATLLVLGCKSAPPAAPVRPQAAASASFPPRPATPPATFKVFHHDATSVTLVTGENASDDAIESLIWELRDAAQAHSFDKLAIPQKLADARDPILWFHIYRGSKCASEKYTDGKLPCGASYHAAGDFTFGSFTERDRTSGVLLHGEDQSTPLWDSEARNPGTPGRPSAPGQ